MRRKLLVLMAAIFLLGCAAIRAADTPPPFTLHEIGPGVWVAIDNLNAKPGSGSNAGFVIGEDGVAVIDTFERVPAAKLLLEDIREKTKLPIRFVVNTHYHLDHVAGNNLFAAAGATVLAQQNVRAWERTENLKFFGPKITPQQKEFVETLGLPTLSYQDGVDLYLGQRKLVVRALPGHTGSDSVIYVPDAHVVFCGDLFWNHTLPNLIDASTKPWLASLAILLKNHPDATFVPGHGNSVGKAEDVRAFREYLIALRGAVATQQASGKSGEALIRSVEAALRPKYENWLFYKYFIQTDIRYTDEELRGTKKLPQPQSENKIILHEGSASGEVN